MDHSATHNRYARRTIATLATALALLVVTAVPVGAQRNAGCEEEGSNMQCSEFGQIKMLNQVDVRGEPVEVDVEVRIDETYERAGARWVMFSIRHDDPRGNSPVDLDLLSIQGPHGDIYTTRIDHDVANEINIWVHVVDIPTHETITIKVKVSVADRGAFKLESLVMPFDRGYEPLRTPDGEDRTLYASTLLGVNQETGAGGGDKKPLGGIRTVPAPALPLAALALVGVAFAWRRRSA